MKNTIWILLFLIGSMVKGQNRVTDTADSGSGSFAEKLVTLAWENNPGHEVVRRNVNVAEYNVKLSGLEWLNIVSFSGNLNEFNINPGQDMYNRSQFLPRYNVAANLSLGMLFTIPTNTKRSREELMITRSVVENHRLTLEAEVLRLYNNYLMQESIHNLQSEMAMDAENNLKLGEQKFKNGEMSFDQYSELRTSYRQARISFFQAEASYKNAKVSLEEFIGMKLEEVQ